MMFGINDPVLGLGRTTPQHLPADVLLRIVDAVKRKRIQTGVTGSGGTVITVTYKTYRAACRALGKQP